MRSVDAERVADHVAELCRWPDDDESSATIRRRAGVWAAVVVVARVGQEFSGVVGEAASLALLLTLLLGLPWLIVALPRAVLWWRTRAYTAGESA